MDAATVQGAWNHPAFGALRADALRLAPGGVPVDDWVARANALAAARGLRTRGGAPLRFVPAESLDDGHSAARAYEQRILDSGQVACRGTGRGRWHDLHNALVWLAWPLTKAALNAGHGRADGTARRDGGRGRLRDALTLFDESGLLWASHDAGLDQLLRERAWQTLFVDRRAALAAQARIWPIGHGLLEKLHTPFKAITAQVLILPPAPPGPTPSGLAPMRADLDAALARQIDQWIPVDGGGPRRFCPLPVQGLPGWDPANADRSYYADVRVFRPLPACPQPVGPATGRPFDTETPHAARLHRR